MSSNIRRGILLVLTLTFLFPLVTSSCTGGDDDGRRLGEMIVGVWERGWNEGDVVIEGTLDQDIDPTSISFDRFEFFDDGSYNGMVRKGTFSLVEIDEDGEENELRGSYQCDNHNLSLKATTLQGSMSLLLQVVSFSEDTMQVRYVNESYHVTVTVTLRKVAV